MCQKSFEQVRLSLGPVVNILAIFSNANILKENKRIKRYHIKGIGCPLLILIDIVIVDHETENKKEEKNDQTGKQARSNYADINAQSSFLS